MKKRPVPTAVKVDRGAVQPVAVVVGRNFSVSGGDKTKVGVACVGVAGGYGEGRYCRRRRIGRAIARDLPRVGGRDRTLIH